MKSIRRTQLIKKISTKVHYKLFVIVVMVIIVLLISTVSVSFYFSTNETYQEMVNSNQSSMKMAQTYIKEKVKNYDELLYSTFFDKQFITSLRSNDNFNDKSKSLKYTEDRLIDLFNSDPKNIHQISAYTVEDNRLVTVPKNYQISISYDSSHNLEWENFKFEGRYLFEAYNDYFTIKKDVNDFDNRESIAILSMSVEWSVMDSAFKMLEDKQENPIFVISKEGRIVYNPMSNQILTDDIQQYLTNKNEDFKQEFAEIDNYYIFSQPIESDLYIMKFVSRETVLSSGQSILKTGVIIGIIAIVTLLVITLVFYWHVTQPIRLLADEMDQIVEDNFQTSIVAPQNRFDEIGVIQRSFVKMLDKVKHLIQIEYKHELEKQQAQYQALQNKIHPHFIYNSLQLIGQAALSNQGEKVYSLVDTLGKMFRYTLRANKDIAMISEEVNHVEQYLYIQKQRFKERLVVDLYMDEEIENSTIPILTLQPIVENAFIHGFTSAESLWKISISIEKVFDEVEIRITDNGKGIKPSVCDEMNYEFKHGMKDLSYVTKSMGLKNVNNRLRLIYGNEYGINLFSKQYKETEIFIRIPFIT